MTKRAYRSAAFLCALLASLAPAGTSRAAHFVPDKAEQKCRKIIAKKFSKLASTADKVIAGCHKSRNKGKILVTVDCNDLSPSQADSRGKVAKAQNKLKSAIQKSCADAGIDNDVLTEFGSCAEPCASSTGVSSPLADYSELGQCLACLAGDLVQSHDVFILGRPDPSVLGKDEQKCHATIAKGYGKYLTTILKNRTKCQAAQDKAGSSDITTCFTADSKGKIAKALAKAEARVEKSCAGAALTVIDSCAPTSVAGLNSCLAGETGGTGADLFTASYQRNAPICPQAISTTIIAGPGSKTVQDAGWTGIGHGADLIDGFSIGYGLSCSSGAAPCGSCTITGVTDAGPQYHAFTRCKADPTIPCNTPFTTDPACPDTQECSFFLGPPLPQSAANTPTCVLNRLASDATGSINVESGALAMHVDSRSIVFSGISLTQPCPVCAGDTSPGDGIKQGSCSGGVNDGQPCDVQGRDATFGATSLDCQLAKTQNMSGEGLIIGLDLTTSVATLPFETPCDFPLKDKSCACAVCTGDTSMPCRNDGECAALSAGSCASRGGGANRQPNNCSDGVCTDMGSEQGVCLAGQDVMFCDGQLRANGRGFLICGSDADCRAIDSVCSGGNCGSCTLSEQASCFLDPIVATGLADPDAPTLATTFCIPPTNGSAINTAAGLPGPARGLIDVTTGLRY